MLLVKVTYIVPLKNSMLNGSAFSLGEEDSGLSSVTYGTGSSS